MSFSTDPPLHVYVILNAPFCTMGLNTFWRTIVISLQMIFDQIFKNRLNRYYEMCRSVIIRIILQKYFIELLCFLLLLQVHLTAYWPYFYMVWRGFDVETSSEFRRKLSHKNAIKLEFGQEEVSFLERLLSADQIPVSWVFFFLFFPEFRRKLLGPHLSVDLRCFWSFIVGALLQKVSFLYPLVQIDTK